MFRPTVLSDHLRVRVCDLLLHVLRLLLVRRDAHRHLQLLAPQGEEEAEGDHLQEVHLPLPRHGGGPMQGQGGRHGAGHYCHRGK